VADPQIVKNLIEGSGLSHKQNSISWIVDCPRCGKEKLYISKRSGNFICWICSETQGFKGRPEYVLSELLCQPLAVVKERLYGTRRVDGVATLDIYLEDFFGDDDIIEEGAAEIPKIPWPFDYFPLDNFYGKRGLDYVEGRGIPAEIAKVYGLRYCPQRRRVAFPIELDGHLVGYQERTVLEETKFWDEDRGKFTEIPKILSSTGIPRERVVMFADRLKGLDYAVLAEGPIDAIKLHRCGGNVCAMGKAVSRGQIAFLRNHGISKIYLALDPDAAEETRRLVAEFSDIEVYLMHPPKGYKDIGDMSLDDAYELFLSAPKVNRGRLFVYLKNLIAK
jgi:hypothetical protein